jgi:hypothetical protein
MVAARDGGGGAVLERAAQQLDAWVHVPRGGLTASISISISDCEFYHGGSVPAGVWRVQLIRGRRV